MRVRGNVIKQKLEEKIEAYKESVKWTKNIEKKIQVRYLISLQVFVVIREAVLKGTLHKYNSLLSLIAHRIVP
jgi:hypothetical protein